MYVVCFSNLFCITMSSELRFRRTVKINNKEEDVDLLTLALKKDAEYDKVFHLLLLCFLFIGIIS